MIALAKSVDLFKMRFGDLRFHDNGKKIIVFYRQGLMFAFNFNPTQSFTDVKVSLPHIADYEVVLNTDDPKYGGQGLIGNVPYPAIVDEKGNSVISLYLPARSALVLKEGEIRQLPVGKAEEAVSAQDVTAEKPSKTEKAPKTTRTRKTAKKAEDK